MKKYIVLIFFILFFAPQTFSIEIEQPKAVQSFIYVLPDNNEIDIHTKDRSEEFSFPSEVELKGSVIYDAGADINREIELEIDEDIEKPKIRLKTANMVIPVDEKKVYTEMNLYTPVRSALSTASRLTGEEYVIAPVWSYVQERIGNFSYGTYYSSGIDTAQLQSTMNIYTRYDFKHFAISGGVAANERNIDYSADDRIVHIAPEIKLSKSFVIRDTVQAYVNSDVKKNKISVIYTPQWQKHPDTFRLELGITNSYYTGGKVNSAIEFSTKIRL